VPATSASLGPDLWRFLLAIGAAVMLVAGLAAAVVGVRARGQAAQRDEPEPRARRFLRVSFALLWILDGLLQAQPQMPTGFMGMVGEETSGSGWLTSVIDPLARAWARHPVAADAATVSVQVGLGVLLLVGRRGRLSRLAAWTAIAWGLVVWVLGEGFGGLLHPGATWESGAPGAVLIYVLAAAFLLLPEEAWRTGRAPRVARRASAVFLAVAAVLQALPGEGGWTAAGAAEPFVAGAQQTQPNVFAWPFEPLAGLAARAPAPVNGVVVALVAAAAIALWVSGRRLVLVAAIVLCVATWWLAQDFGVLGGMATDPNTALPLAVLIAAVLPGWRAPASAFIAKEPSPGGRLRAALLAGGTVMAVLLTLVVPLALAGVLPGPADSAAVAGDSEGGLRAIPPRPLPDFDLTDQNGQRISPASLRGKLVLLTFLDPVCSSDCPLIAAQLALADRRLGSVRDRVEIVAIDSNPLFPHVEDVAAFTESHGLTDLPNWHFVCGPSGTVQDLLAEFGITVSVPAVGMIEHSEAIYFVTPDGLEAAYLADGAGEQLTSAYSTQIGDEIRSLL
jgi:cytochrome oxidase Cu insertion factor (SCO1/SenC/PrrC family)